MTFKFSDEQNKIFEVAATGQNICIEAGAGTGKTATMLEMASRLPGNTAYLVFNKAAQEDALKRIKALGLGDKIKPTTIHSLAYTAMPSELKEKLYDKSLPSRDIQIYRLLGKTKDVFIGATGNRIKVPGDTLIYLAISSFKAFCMTGDSNPSLSHIQYLDGIDENPLVDRSNNDKLAGYVLAMVRKLWEDCLTGGSVKLNHDTYLKRWAATSPDIDADRIVLDESQDSNAVNTSVLLHNHTKYGTQLIVVGDQMQQLYSFRSVSDPTPHIVSAAHLQLSQTYRCGNAITEIANLIPKVATSSMVLVGNPEVDASVNTSVDGRIVDAILCRTNSAVIEAASNELSDFIEAGNSGPYPLVCMTDGCKSAAKELIAAYESISNGKTISDGTYRRCRNVDALKGKIGVLVIPRTKALQVQVEGREQEVRMADTEEDSATGHLPEVLKMLEIFGVEATKKVFDGRQRNNRVRCLTVHQAKGLEWDSVRISRDLEPKLEDSNVPTDDERCSLYVAVTRAKEYLDVSQNPYLRNLLTTMSTTAIM